jgi:hypothetical protein
MYSPDIPKTAEELELEAVIRDLAARYDAASTDSAEQRMVERQLDGISRGGGLGRLLIEEYYNGGHRYW